jgi:hypothetical protein
MQNLSKKCPNLNSHVVCYNFQDALVFLQFIIVLVKLSYCLGCVRRFGNYFKVLVHALLTAQIKQGSTFLK